MYKKLHVHYNAIWYIKINLHQLKLIEKKEQYNICVVCVSVIFLALRRAVSGASVSFGRAYKLLPFQTCALMIRLRSSTMRYDDRSATVDFFSSL